MVVLGISGRICGLLTVSHMWIYSYLFIYWGALMKELGKYEETVFQPLNYTDQGILHSPFHRDPGPPGRGILCWDR